jgi:excisionase family DNA binding protein
VIPDPASQPTVALWPDAGQALGVGRAKVFELARSGQLPFPVYRLGRSWRVPTAALRRALHLDPDGGDAST